MQLTLDDLRKASDPLALLLAMSDSDLDRVAAVVVGFRREKGTLLGELIESWRDHKNATIFDYEWKPSRNLDQAYELEQRCRERCGLYVRRIWGSRKFMYILTPLTEPGETYDKDRAGVWELDAGSHARAVTILAILGLSGKDGAA